MFIYVRIVTAGDGVYADLPRLHKGVGHARDIGSDILGTCTQFQDFPALAGVFGNCDHASECESTLSDHHDRVVVEIKNHADDSHQVACDIHILARDVHEADNGARY